MAIFKCKMCGAELTINDNSTICECDYCGSKQSIPTQIDETINSLFNRANNLRLRAEFDKAQQIYEKIVELKPNEPEAYWGLVLSEYGIEYVEDKNTLKRVPTCHRASYESILTNNDYKLALQYASIEQKLLYEQEAKLIDTIQKQILEISNKEEAFDVFICYKQTDDNNNRTKDSVIANDIYYQLTQAGYKVFYAAITLEDKLGSQYEPYIFSALNSAKVMLVLGSKPEYFNAVWVKNEWSRFLKQVKQDHKKLLIPCYLDMDAYDLPEEFSLLQAQDMSKIGFINDLIRGIEKVIVKDNIVNNTNNINNTFTNTNAISLLKRGYMALEDKEFDVADKFFEDTLNLDAENSQAYLGKLMVELQVSTKQELNNCDLFDHNKNYIKALRFADDEFKKELNCYIDNITARINKEKNDKLEYLYNEAVRVMNNSKTVSDYQKLHQNSILLCVSRTPMY